jgi:RNA polymerase sigma-70 factor (ECF subfamily)
VNTPELDAAALRRLARGLVFDGDAAHDVVQEAWLAALRRDPHAAAAQGWLAGAVKRIALGRRRDEARRRAREAMAARSETQRTAEDVPERLEVLRALLAAVERLDEPYRAAVVMRYLDDLPPREIAHRTGVPVDTARTHVRRGLERLRADLDGPRGPGREALLGALVPLMGPEGGSLAAATGLTWMGGIAMNKLVAGTLLLVAAAAAWWGLRDPSAPLAPPAVVHLDAAGPGALEAREPAAPEVSAPVAPAQESERTAIAAAPTYEVSGVILLGVDAPLPGGRVRLQVLAGAGLAGEVLLDQRLQADEAGEFLTRVELSDEPRTIALQEDEPEHYGHRTWITAVAGDEPWGPWMVPAFPLDVVVDGRVVDEQGEGIGGARVVQRVYEADREVATDEAGRFRMRLSSRNDSTRLVVAAEGYAEAVANIALRGPGGLTLAPITLEPEARLSGRVLDAQGRPVEAAQVRNRRLWLAEWTVTDADGRFEVGALAPDGPTAWLEVRHPDFAWLERDAKLDDEPLELMLERGYAVGGRVRDSAGAVVAGAWVRLGSSRSPGNEPPVITDAQGRFVLDQRTTGFAHVWVWADGFASRRAMASPPSNGADTVEVEVTLEPERVLRGRVLLPDGEPKPWALVYVEDRGDPRQGTRFDSLQSWSDAQGRFALRGIPGGPVRAGATVSGYRRVEVDLPEVTSEELELRLAPATGLAGRVVDAATGAPVTEFTLRVRHAPGPDGRMSSSGGISTTWTDHGVAFSDEQGRWSVSGLELPPEAFLAVEVEAPDYAAGRLASVPVALDPAPESCVVELSRGTLVVGRIVDAEQRPIAGARVIPATDERDVARAVERPEPRAHVFTDAGGRFELPALPTGTARLLVLAEGHPPIVDGPFEVLGDATVRRDIELTVGARVHGRLLDAQSRPLVGENISLYALEGVARTREHEAVTDERGAFELAAVAPGTYHLRWRREHGGRTLYDRVRLVEVTGDEDVELDLVPAGTASVHGRVLFTGDVPKVAIVTILPAPDPATRPDPRGFAYARTALGAFVLDGEFYVDGLPAGQQTFLVSYDAADGSSQMGSTRLVLAEGEHAEVEVVLRSLDRSR